MSRKFIDAWLIKFRNSFVSSKLSQIKKKICKLKQVSNNSRENLQMLGSLNLEIYLSHQKLSQIKKKISKSKQFSNKCHENSSMLGSLNLKIHLSHQN